MLKRMLADMGIESQRLRLEWISAAEGEKSNASSTKLVATLIPLGPLGIPQKFDQWTRRWNISPNMSPQGRRAGGGWLRRTLDPTQNVETLMPNPKLPSMVWPRVEAAKKPSWISLRIF